MKKKNYRNRIPLQTLEQLALAQVVYLQICEAVLKQNPELPQAPIQLALNLAQRQLNTIYEDIKRRSTPENAEQIMEKCFSALEPQSQKENENEKAQ